MVQEVVTTQGQTIVVKRGAMGVSPQVHRCFTVCRDPVCPTASPITDKLAELVGVEVDILSSGVQVPARNTMQASNHRTIGLIRTEATEMTFYHSDTVYRYLEAPCRQTTH